MQALYENHYLDDEAIANYARHSFADLAKNFTKEQNDNLVRFLARGMSGSDWGELIQEMLNLKEDHHDYHQASEELAVYLRKIPEHWVPFGHPHITLRCSAPIPIRTQCFKHKVGLVESEESRRYIKTEPEFYFPEYFRKSADNVKQGSADEPMDETKKWEATYKDWCLEGKRLYLKAIDEGMCPEQARFFLPQGTIVNWVWTGSLYAFANFYNQRSDSHAQKEIQILAEQVNEIISPLFPVAWPALTKGAY